MHAETGTLTVLVRVPVVRKCPARTPLRTGCVVFIFLIFLRLVRELQVCDNVLKQPLMVPSCSPDFPLLLTAAFLMDTVTRFLSSLNNLDMNVNQLIHKICTKTLLKPTRIIIVVSCFKSIIFLSNASAGDGFLQNITCIPHSSCLYASSRSFYHASTCDLC
jgi:hypothetical protein